MSAAIVNAPLALHDVAGMDCTAFVAALGGLFEHSPWVAEAAWAKRPFASEDALHAAMMAAVREVPRVQQIAFLCAHPELAGKEAQAGTMTGHSTHEQTGAGLDRLSHAEFVELQQLNAAYRERHGFPFVIMALGHTRAQIFEAVRTRTGNETPHEIEAALQQIASITRRRVAARFGNA